MPEAIPESSPGAVPEPALPQQWWERCLAALEQKDWPLLEGSVLRLLEVVPPQPELLDLLGHALLMQGRFQRSQEALEQALAAGSRNFWTPHKLGDAHRGLQRPAIAVAAYEQALEWGSDSPLTVRNLLEVLHGEEPAAALARLEQLAASAPPPWDWQQPPAWLAAASAAAINVQGPLLAEWLCSRGCPKADVRALAWQERLYRLELPGTLELLSGSPDRREQALQRRLLGLLEQR